MYSIRTYVCVSVVNTVSGAQDRQMRTLIFEILLIISIFEKHKFNLVFSVLK